ncbi:MAG: hypothetical protein H6510_08885 [Acidobacteria bacterium]|nr:hypothetical protein [Acidobacteriota bacterium]MCB9397918.1 hypothetical protein [Acidobacteriota bacterium]
MKRFFRISLFLAVLPLFAQSNVAGSVPITLVDGGLGCGGSARIIEVHANVTGLSGDSGAMAGLNAFQLTVSYSVSGVYTHTVPGSNPQTWTIVTSAAANNASQVVVVGWNTNTLAPNASYHLCDIYLSGPNGNVTVNLTGGELASRLVTPGNGPAALNVTLPPSLTVFVPAYTLDLPDAIASWRLVNPTYNLIGPPGPNDILDLVKAFICAP